LLVINELNARSAAASSNAALSAVVSAEETPETTEGVARDFVFESLENVLDEDEDEGQQTEPWWLT